MCAGSSVFSRSSFLAIASAAAMTAAAAADPAPPLSVPQGLTPGNARAARIASASPFVRRCFAAAGTLARSIGDAKLRASVLDLLERPAPRYAQRYRNADARAALRDTLAREGLIDRAEPVNTLFPPGTNGDAPVQAFWSAPGSDLSSHHSYPGGLLVHEFANASFAANFDRTYDAIYFGAARTLDRDAVVAAAFYHDIMKTVVFQFNDDGTLLGEGHIARTGAHHCLSGAEAIIRGHDARFVTILLSAHAAPSLGDEAKVVQWCRAAAMIAGVDPVEYGLVSRTAQGYALAALPPVEAFVSYLSDHDFVLTIPAVRALAPEIAKIDPSLWFRHETFATHSAVALYEALIAGKLSKTLRG